MDFSKVKILKREDYSVHIRKLITNEGANFASNVIAVSPEGVSSPEGFATPQILLNCKVSPKDELREVLPKEEPIKILTKDVCREVLPKDDTHEDLPEDGTKSFKCDDEEKMRKAGSAEKHFQKKSTLPVLEHISPLLSTYIEKSSENDMRMSRSIRILRENGIFGNSELFGYLTDSRDFIVIGCIGLQGVGKSTIMSSLVRHSTFYNTQEPIFGIQKKVSCDHETCGMDVFITKNGVFLLDTPPIISPSSMKRLVLQEYRRKHKKDVGEPPLITDQLSTTSENAMELHSLRMAAFVLSVCHVVLLVQDWFFDPNVIRFLKSAEMLKPRKIDVTKLKHLSEHFPHVVFVQNKASVSQYTQESITMMQTVYGKCFEKSNLMFRDNICNLEDTSVYVTKPNSYKSCAKKEEIETEEYSSVNVWVLPKFEDPVEKLEKPDNGDEDSDDLTSFDESEEESDDHAADREQCEEREKKTEQMQEQTERTQKQTEKTQEQADQIQEQTKQMQEQSEQMLEHTGQTRRRVENTRKQTEQSLEQMEESSEQVKQTREQDERSIEKENKEDSCESRSEEDKESSSEENDESLSENDRSTESEWETTDYEEATDDEVELESDYTDDETESDEETEDETEEEMESEDDSDDQIESEGSIGSMTGGADKVELEATKIKDEIENETVELEKNDGENEGFRFGKNSIKNNLFVQKCLVESSGVVIPEPEWTNLGEPDGGESEYFRENSSMMKPDDIYESIAQLFAQCDDDDSSTTSSDKGEVGDVSYKGIPRLFVKREDDDLSVMPSDESEDCDVIYEGIFKLFAQHDDDDDSSLMSSDESDCEENANANVTRDFDYWIRKLGDELKNMERNKLGCAMLSEKAWFYYSSRVWDTIMKSQLFTEYDEFLP